MHGNVLIFTNTPYKYGQPINFFYMQMFLSSHQPSFYMRKFFKMMNSNQKLKMNWFLKVLITKNETNKNKINSFSY
jgi:hypothetical protein